MADVKLRPLEKLEISFSEKMEGVIWKTLADPEKNRLYIECRNSESKNVTFSALDLDTNSWLWRNIAFDEPWWISLNGFSGDVLLLSVFNDRSDPGKSSLVAFDAVNRTMIWWKNNFSPIRIFKNAINGTDISTGREQLLSLSDGAELRSNSFVGEEQNLMITRPFQYHEGSAYFESVRAFLETHCHFSAVTALEYVEFGPFIIISTFVNRDDLANYLIVCSATGQVLVKETLGEHLEGLAADTFFIFSCYLIFVKNKRELVSYKFI